jgi:hypothetical protein
MVYSVLGDQGAAHGAAAPSWAAWSHRQVSTANRS